MNGDGVYALDAVGAYTGRLGAVAVSQLDAAIVVAGPGVHIHNHGMLALALPVIMISLPLTSATCSTSMRSTRMASWS